MFIYCIHSNSNTCKIGFAKNPERRLKQLQTSCPEKLSLTCKLSVGDVPVRKLEQHLHRELSYKRIRGEWFNLTKEEAQSFLDYASIRWKDDYLLI